MIANKKNIGFVSSNTNVLMYDGSVKRIEDISTGDLIMTSDGIGKPVLDILDKNYSGNLFQVKSKNNKEILCDSNIIFQKVNMEGTDPTRIGLSALNHSKNKYILNYTYSTIDIINKGDLLLSPVIGRTIKNNLTPNRARLLGIYTAEGSFAKKYNKRQSVRFTLGIKENNLAQNIKTLCEEEFPECSVKINPEPTRSVIEVTLSGFNIAEYFYHHCGEYSHLKKLSPELCYSNNEIKRHFLSGYIDGDGCISDSNKIIIITTSDNLAFQVRNMFNSMKISNCVRKVYTSKKKPLLNKKYNKEYSRKDNFRIELTGTSYKKMELEKLATIKINFIESNSRDADNFRDNYCLHFVRDIKSVIYDGKMCAIITGDNDLQIMDGIISTSYWSK
jgi:intein/homing endonuclease